MSSSVYMRCMSLAACQHSSVWLELGEKPRAQAQLRMLLCPGLCQGCSCQLKKGKPGARLPVQS